MERLATPALWATVLVATLLYDVGGERVIVWTPLDALTRHPLRQGALTVLLLAGGLLGSTAIVLLQAVIGVLRGRALRPASPDGE